MDRGLQNTVSPYLSNDSDTLVSVEVNYCMCEKNITQVLLGR